MTDNEYELGDEISVIVIGLFMRNDNDHKYIVVEHSREIDDISQLPDDEMEILRKLYP